MVTLSLESRTGRSLKPACVLGPNSLSWTVGFFLRNGCLMDVTYSLAQQHVAR